MIDRRIAAALINGLFAPQKQLPSWLFYDDTGCKLYDQITRLPEYYLTRAESEILREHADDIVSVLRQGVKRVSLAELGAGTATKTQWLLAALTGAQGASTYLACDIATGVLQQLAQGISAAHPLVELRTCVGEHTEAGPLMAQLPGRQALLFLGSSVGNYPDADAVQLLAEMKTFLRSDALLILGTDLKKSLELIQAAYDDAQGVTAAFNKNVLQRLNRELMAEFDPTMFRHVAHWNESTSNIELYLESCGAQRVRVNAFPCEVVLAPGERILTEICAKYDDARVDRVLHAAGWTRAQSFRDRDKHFGLHIAHSGI